MLEKKKKPNRVMQSMIGVSLAIHAVIAMHIAGIYQSEALTYIELAMRDISKPASRAIPRPSRTRKAPHVHDVKKLNVSAKPIAAIKTDTLAYDNSVMEDIAVPDTAGDIDNGFAAWDALGGIGAADHFATRNDYFDMVRLKIESRKKYPGEAQERQIQGRVKVRFVITADGRISSLQVAKSSRHTKLDQAALAAVENAMPFPPLPASLFDQKAITVEIVVIFELT